MHSSAKPCIQKKSTGEAELQKNTVSQDAGRLRCLQYIANTRRPTHTYTHTPTHTPAPMSPFPVSAPHESSPKGGGVRPALPQLLSPAKNSCEPRHLEKSSSSNIKLRSTVSLSLRSAFSSSCGLPSFLFYMKYISGEAPFSLQNHVRWKRTTKFPGAETRSETGRASES